MTVSSLLPVVIASGLLSATTAAASPVPLMIVPDRTTSCALERLKPFVSPYGIRQAWPVMDRIPKELDRLGLGTRMSDMGDLADGYQQFIHTDLETRTVYILEQGGFAGTTKVYGPLPLPHCGDRDKQPMRLLLDTERRGQD